MNDVIETNNFVGRVSRITLRDTQIAQLDGQIVVVPNKEIFNKPVVNHSSALQRRVGFEIKAPPDVELDEALRLAHDAVSGIDSRDRRREIELFFQSIDDTGTTLLVRFWIDSADEIEYLRARSLGIQRTKSAFDHRPQHAQHT